MAKKKSARSKKRQIPKVRIVQPAGRPFQIRYRCPTEEREIRVSVGSRDWEEAEAVKAEIEARLLLGLSTRSPNESDFGPDMDWEYFREQYRVLHLAAVRDKTAAAAESRLDIAQRVLKPKRLRDMAEPAALQQLQARLLAGDHSLKKKRRSPHTVKGYMGAVLSALRWAHLQGWLPTAPKIRGIKTSKQKSMRGRPITAQEFGKMLRATRAVVGKEAAPSWRFLLRGLWESALRIDELMHVSWDKPRTIRPIWSEGKHPLLDIPAAMQKNDTDQAIPLLPGFERLLLRVPEAERKGWVFNPESLQLRLSRKVQFNRPNADWVGKIVSRIGKEAGIVVEEADERTEQSAKYASAHDLRRSCGERLRNAGVPPLVICRVMRHSSWETTRKHYAPGDVQSDAAVLYGRLNAD